jgi:hypothetical protein
MDPAVEGSVSVVDGASSRSALLGAVNDMTAAVPYGDGFLVDLPFVYSDGDSVRALVEPYSGDALRVTDRAEALDRLSSFGVNVGTGRVAVAVREAVRSSGLNMIGSAADELATVTNEADLGAALLAIGGTAIRVEQLRWLATDRPGTTFTDRVTTRLTDVAGKRWKVDRAARMRTQSGRRRRVTAAVTGELGTAYVQAIGQPDDDRAVEHCYYLFDRSTVEKGHRIAALAGTHDDWSPAITEDLAVVGQLAYFDEGGQLEDRIAGIAGLAGAVRLGE